MNYTQTLQALYQRNEFSIKLGLSNIRRLLTLLGHPEKYFPALHVAGTNGKGSVCAMIASVLQASGYRTGLYTSPHLIDFRERIQIQGCPISKKELVQGYQRIQALMEKEKQRKKNFSPTYFEIVTALAFDFFARHKVDIAVLETGLGGRLDATNLCHPLVTVITHVDWDHQAYLGNRLRDIAMEKAGILKQGIPCVTAERKSSILQLLKSQARQNKAKLIPLFESQNAFLNGSYQGIFWHLDSLQIPLSGIHQHTNAFTALRTLEELSQQGFPIPPQAIHTGLKKTHWLGRFHIVSQNPQIILDGAHNPEALQMLVTTLQQKKIQKVVFIFGMMQDKDIKKAIRILGQISRTFYLVEAPLPRATSVESLKILFKKIMPKGNFYPIKKTSLALQLTQRQFHNTGYTICVCGSLYIVGEALKALRIPTL